MLVVEHNLGVVRRVADRVIALDGGRDRGDCGLTCAASPSSRSRSPLARRPAARRSTTRPSTLLVVVNAPFSSTPYLGRTIENGARLAADEVNATASRVGDGEYYA